MIRILSLNVNDFGGCYHLEEFKKKYREQAYSRWDKIDKKRQTKEILSYIRAKSPDIVILQEFEIGRRTEYSTSFLDEMTSMEYIPIPYDKGDAIRPSITIMFTKKDLRYEPLDNPHDKKLRASVIKCSDFIIYGVHIPYKLKFCLKFWNELIKYYHKNKMEKIMIIGDFNVYEEGTPRKDKFKELLNQGAIDAWVECGYPSKTPTYGNSRIDYAIVSPSMFQEMKEIDICPILKNKGMTDHAALIVDIKQNDK